ncbi:MAG: major capsid protein [Prevotella sp.]
MPGTFLGYPFDEEIFLLNWKAAIDPVRTAMIDSGAVQTNREIARMIANGSNQYTIPFYNVLGGTPDNYDGTTDMTVTEPDGGYQTGVVYGRMHAWKDRDFIHDFNSGANPMTQISSQVAKFWNKKRQDRLIGIMSGIFGLPDDESAYWDAWQLHTLNIALASGSTAGEANMVDAASAADAMQKACGDNSGIFSMAIMHSKVANDLAKKQLLEFRKYTDAAGIERTVNIADWNGLTVIVDDGVPATPNAQDLSAVDYTTYLFGTGAIQYAEAPVEKPVETDRVVLEAGGYNVLATRFRETLHPNGFSYTLPAATISPTDVQLATAAQWKVVVDPKAIPIARIISNG